MTTATAQTQAPARLADRIGQAQQAVSDRAHAAGDEFAREAGWTITRGTGRFGFGARSYHDPRFGASAPGASARASRSLRQISRGWETGQ